VGYGICTITLYGIDIDGLSSSVHRSTFKDSPAGILNMSFHRCTGSFCVSNLYGPDDGGVLILDETEPSTGPE
jgi:hypothetical protein